MTDVTTRRNRRLILVAGLVVVVILLYATRHSTLPIVGGWLDVGQSPERTDFVMLLNGDQNTRPFKVADLLVRDLADRAIITSVQQQERPLLDPEVHVVARAILNRCGVEDARIEFVDSRVSTTFDEAKTLERVMDQYPAATFAVVTNTYHTRRSRWVLRHVLGERMNRVRMVSAPTDYYDASNWWTNQEGFVLYLSEFLKASFYFVRYGDGVFWLVAVIGLLIIGRLVRIIGHQKT